MYILVILFPQFLFANKLDYKNFEVYYHTDIDAQEIKYVLDLSADLLKESELKRSTNQKVFITDSYNEFTFFALLSRKSFAVNYPVIQNIFLTKSDISQNTITSNNDLYNKRNLSGVIAHETIHSLLEDRLGLLRYKMLPSWKNEGYADFVSKESSYNETKGLKAICNIDVNPQSSSYRYFEYKIVTAYLLSGAPPKRISGDSLQKYRFCFSPPGL